MSILGLIKSLIIISNPGEYVDRWIMPQAKRLDALGISDNDAKRLFEAAVERADPTVVGLAPGSLFRDMVDRIEAGETVDEVLSL